MQQRETSKEQNGRTSVWRYFDAYRDEQTTVSHLRRSRLRAGAGRCGWSFRPLDPSACGLSRAELSRSETSPGRISREEAGRRDPLPHPTSQGLTPGLVFLTILRARKARGQRVRRRASLLAGASVRPRGELGAGLAMLRAKGARTGGIAFYSIRSVS